MLGEGWPLLVFVPGVIEAEKCVKLIEFDGFFAGDVSGGGGVAGNGEWAHNSAKL